MKKSTLLVLATSLSATLLGGCVYRERTSYPSGATEETVVGTAPPAPLVDETIVAPGPGYVWIGGAWVWHGHDWHWERGRWERPPHRGAMWVPPHYAYRNGVHVYIRGRWD